MLLHLLDRGHDSRACQARDDSASRGRQQVRRSLIPVHGLSPFPAGTAARELRVALRTATPVPPIATFMRRDVDTSTILFP
jgi:hypothetical protein